MAKYFLLLKVVKLQCWKKCGKVLIAVIWYIIGLHSLNRNISNCNYFDWYSKCNMICKIKLKYVLLKYIQYVWFSLQGSVPNRSLSYTVCQIWFWIRPSQFWNRRGGGEEEVEKDRRRREADDIWWRGGGVGGEGRRGWGWPGHHCRITMFTLRC